MRVVDSYIDYQHLIKETNNTIRDLLMELGEDRLIKDADTMSGVNFFLYPSSAYRMASNTWGENGKNNNRNGS